MNDDPLPGVNRSIQNSICVWRSVALRVRLPDVATAVIVVIVDRIRPSPPSVLGAAQMCTKYDELMRCARAAKILSLIVGLQCYLALHQPPRGRIRTRDRAIRLIE